MYILAEEPGITDANLRIRRSYGRRITASEGAAGGLFGEGRASISSRLPPGTAVGGSRVGPAPKLPPLKTPYFSSAPELTHNVRDFSYTPENPS